MRTNSTFFTVTNPTLPLNFLFILFLMLCSVNVFGQVTINRATGNINSCVFPTSYTTLGDIYLEENQNNNFAFANRNDFTLIITAPTNFEFLAGVGSVSYRNNQDITAASISVTVTTITVTYRSDQMSRTNGDDRLTISGIQFRGITGPSSGDMTRTGGTGTINGAPNGAVFGTLTSTNNPLPAIGGGVAAVCVGAATPAFTNATPGGTWSITNGSGAATITSGGVVTGTAAGTVTVIYSLNGCVANRSLTINPLPAAIAGGSTAVCVGSSTPAFTNATGGGTWSVIPGTGNGTITAGGVLTGTSAGTVTVRYTLASGCYTSSAPITVNPLPATVTTPSPANGAAGVCYAGTGAVSGISWGAAPGATSYDVYFGAGSLPGTAINVATNSYNTGVLLANTTYYWRVVAKNGCGDAVSSATWSFTTSGTPCYCPSIGGTFPDGITGVNFNTINNLGTSVDTGYNDYTSISTTVLKGYTYPLNLYINTGGNYTNYQSAYIDWNGDGDFVDAGEFYNLGTATNVTNGSSSASPLNITVPGGAVTGSVRMRIQSRYNSATTGPCQTGFDGEVEDYTINIVPALPCTTPTAQPTNLVLTPSAGTINGNFTAAVPPAYSYLVVMNTTGIAPAPADNVDYAIGSNALGGTNIVVDNDSNTTFTATTLNPLTTYYFFVFSNNNYCTGGTKYLVANPLTGNATTPVTNYCIPSTSNSTEYIAGVTSVGTLNDVSNSPTGYSPNGYGNYSSVIIATQIPGNGINFNIILPTAPAEAQFIKVWVDWNKDGDFADASEEVYTSGNTATGSTSFGFVVPAAQVTGDYRLRIKTRNFGGAFSGNSTYNSCDSYNRGETEDYTIRIVPDCVAKIIAVTDGAACGPINTVNLNATPGAGSTEVRWYSAPRGGVLLASNTGSWTTPSLSSSTTYYVTAFNGTCESLYRIPVTATINPTPTVSITSSVPAVCSEVVNINLTSAGDFATDTVFFQDFESGMGTFTVSTPTNINAGADTPWSVKTSPYQPTTTTVWKPAVNSGAVGSIGNHFAFTTSDYTNSTIETRMSSPAIDVSPYTDLTLTFDHYYSAYGGDRGVLQVATNAAGNNWTDITTYATDLGSASSFVSETVDLTPYTGIATLRFRFVYIAQWDDGWAVDNVKITGKKPLTTNFDWTGSNVTVYDADCVTPYSASSTAVCIKPSAIQIENSTQFVVNASAILSNGCSAVGTIVIPNETKTWDTASTNWGSNNWKPDTAVPTSDKCVVIKTPVNIGSTTDAVAKNITVKSAGEIEIAGNLTVTDFIKNETGDANNFVVKSDGNLVQINAVTNTDPIRADRYVTDMDNVLATQMDYVYWSAPVTGQKLRGTAAEGGFSPGTPDNRFFEYNEATDYFVSTPDAVFTPGKGYAIRAEVDAVHPANAAGYSETYRFRGIPNNGDIPVNITRSADTGAVVHGYNLVGNPYPSNISFDRLYAGNPGLIFNTVWLWTNATYTLTQQGSGYSGNNYAVYNGSGGNNATTTVAIPAPDGIIKVGQGFLVQKRTQGTGQLLFKNSYGTGQDLRVTDAGTFYQKGAEIKNRFTLTLTSPAQMVNSQLIAYVNGATNGYEQDYDAEIMGMSSDLFYSVLGDRRLLIQGKGVFTDSDAVPLGANFFTDGDYTVSLNNAEGIFAGAQSVYLKDKQTGIITNLSAGSYSFTAAKGISDGRFEVIYKPETILSTDGTQKDDLTVYRDGDDFVIRSSGSKITGVELYDGAGRLLYRNRLNQTATRIEGAELNEGVYVLKIERGALVSSKKIMK